MDWGSTTPSLGPTNLLEELVEPKETLGLQFTLKGVTKAADEETHLVSEVQERGADLPAPSKCSTSRDLHVYSYLGILTLPTDFFYGGFVTWA